LVVVVFFVEDLAVDVFELVGFISVVVGLFVEDVVGLSAGGLLAVDVFEVGFVSVVGVGLFVKDVAKLSLGALSFAVEVFEVSVIFVVIASFVDVLASLSAALIVVMVSEIDGSSSVFAFVVDDVVMCVISRVGLIVVVLSVAGFFLLIDCNSLFDS